MNRASASKPLSPRTAAFWEKTLSGAKALMREEMRLSYGISESAGKCRPKSPSPV